MSENGGKITIRQGGYEECGREDAMRWPREPRVMGILLIFLAVAIYLVMIGEIIPLLWQYRDYPLVRVLLAFLSGGHLEELF